MLQDNGGDNLSVTANGAFTFATALAGGAAYAVTVKTNPSGQTCTVSNGSGTVGSANVTNVAVTCASVATYTVGGTVSGLSGTVVLQDNGGDNLSVTANGVVHLRHRAGVGRGYTVTVRTNPSGQTCTVSNGSGTVGSANVTNVAVTCASVATYSVGGTVSGLSGTVVLQDNGGRQPERDGERVVHVRDPAGVGRGVQRDGADEPVRADLHGVRRLRHGGHRQRHQRRGHLRRASGR